MIFGRAVVRRVASVVSGFNGIVVVSFGTEVVATFVVVLTVVVVDFGVVLIAFLVGELVVTKVVLAVAGAWVVVVVVVVVVTFETEDDLIGFAVTMGRGIFLIVIVLLSTIFCVLLTDCLVVTFLTIIAPVEFTFAV